MLKFSNQQEADEAIQTVKKIDFFPDLIKETKIAAAELKRLSGELQEEPLLAAPQQNPYAHYA